MKVDHRGVIEVNEFGQASAEGVWALGDVANHLQLKHVANAEARVIAYNLLHPEDLRAVSHEVVPSGIFTHPQIGVVGLTEEEARGQYEHITVKTQKYADVAYGWAMEDHTGLCKVIADANSGKIVGAHVMGPQAASLIQLFVTFITFGIDARVAAKNQYWPHPALSEVVENALLGLEFNNPAPATIQP